MKINGYFLAGSLAWLTAASVVAQPNPNSGHNNDQRSVREVPVRNSNGRNWQNNNSINSENTRNNTADSSTDSSSNTVEEESPTDTTIDNPTETTTDETSNTSNNNEDTSSDVNEENSGSSDNSTISGNEESSVTESSGTTWIINSTNERAPYIYESNSNQQVLVNVQSVESVTVAGKEYTRVSATGIPDYQIEITQEILDALISRPKASTDFVNGYPLVQTGEIVSFGQDIGYRSNSSCGSEAGYGFWPPGPVCPENVDHVGYIPAEPEASTDSCETGLGVQGYWVNGTSIYQWSDGQSVNNTWHTLAPMAEVYDVDICGGHAANGDYHHHFYSNCLAEIAGDTADGHSPIYGYTADGYAIYGPWESTGVLAKSSWAIRDYDDPRSDTGCGVAGQRSCLLVDEYDIDRGVSNTNNTGPTTSGSYTSQSGNEFETPAGFFYEDYYWDESLTARGGEYLDQYNGHTDSERGYHYHLTVTQDNNGQLIPAFPFTFGPRFAGKLDDQTIVNRCSTTVGR
ncbi:YHYH protein [Microbulbifer sp. JTAC008]|uniref:YHYH protein n=1 Tax=unclassified Microbulbifer TaxID=2619833 RepID=UPI002B2E6AE7|nr:YHYH protein [Microbulbifer sp. MKSA007]